MAEQSASEKSEQPTQKRLRDARKKGQVAKSTDVVTTFVTAIVLFTVFVYASSMSQRIQHFIEQCMLATRYRNLDIVADIARGGLDLLMVLVIPISVAAVIAVIFGNVLQFGFLIATESLTPKLDKLNPINKLKQIFSMKSVIEFVKNLIKLVLLTTVAGIVIWSALGPTLMIPYGGIEAIFQVGRAMFKAFLIAVLLAYVVISIFDFILQKMLFVRDQKMTKDEVKRENKDTEGDPHIKGQRKQLAREMVMEDAPTGARKSTVLVTNPTHYTIGIYFEHGVTPLPKLRAKGMGMIALKMRQVGQEVGVPVVENVPLARALYDRVEPNDYITGDLLEPVAEILRWVATLPAKRPPSG